MNLLTEHTTKEEVTKEYRTYPKTDAANFEQKPFYESRVLPIAYEIKVGSKVLDVGCNDGSFMKLIQEKRNCDVTGIDISDVALEEAKSKGLNVVVGDVESLPFEDESFDYVTCMEVLSHLYDPSKALNEIRRVLKKDGILLGSCPHKNLETFAWDDKRLHRRYFNEEELMTLLKESFDTNHMRILKGGQFAVNLANSFLATESVEMLFKSGGDNTKNWDEALQDRSILRCWFGFTQTPGTVYYRMSGFADKMQKLGAEVHYNPYDEMDEHSPAEWTRKIQYLHAEKRLTNAHIVRDLESVLKASDMSVFQITASRHILLVLTTARLGVIKKPMWCEVDDWLFDLPPYNLASNPYRPNSEPEAVAFEQIKLSDGIICSTNYLKEKLTQLFPSKPIYVIKNSLDFDVWNDVKIPTKLHEENKDLVRITFSGCGNHSGDLELIVKPMKALLEEFPNVEFVSLPYPSTEAIQHERYKRLSQWVTISKYPYEYGSWETDIAIAPLRDNEFNRSKSNLRWLESSALKIPMVASNVYPFRHSIENGKTGILVGNDAKSWYEAIKSLIIDKGKRISMGQNAYEEVKRNYNMDIVAKTYLSVLKGIKDGSLRDLGGVR